MNKINYEELDPGIRLTVKWLRDHGFETTDSGDGKTKLLPGSTYDATDPNCICTILPFPHVACVVDYAILLPEAVRLLHELQEIGIIVRPLGYAEDNHHPAIQATFDPSNKSALIELLNVDDLMLINIIQ